MFPFDATSLEIHMKTQCREGYPAPLPLTAKPDTSQYATNLNPLYFPVWNMIRISTPCINLDRAYQVLTLDHAGSPVLCFGIWAPGGTASENLS